ncbi:MAG: hypothetical protein MN733_18645 [Nitrososphaera sp.]|nr:hypothetical protein [Nitrososphaera sp.]
MTVFGILNLSWDSLQLLFKKRSITAEWKQLSIEPASRGYRFSPPASPGYGFSPEALFDVDIKLPDIKTLTGKAKFIDEPGRIRLGYLITVVVEKLDLTKLPEKYRKERKVKTKAGEFTVVPSEQVFYAVRFEFTFRDKDNFALFTIKSPIHDLSSGKENQFQSIVEEPIPYNVAVRTSEIMFSMSIDKCLTCY